MVDKTATSNVNVQLNPKGLAGAARQVEDAIKRINAEIKNTGTVANGQLRALQQTLKQISTLQGASPQGRLSSDQTAGRQARAFQQLRAAAAGSGTAIDNLRGRISRLNQEAARSGQQLTKTEARRVKNLEDSAKAYQRVGNQITDLRTRVAGFSKSSQAEFKPLLGQLDMLEKKNAKLFANPRRFNFTSEIGQSKASLKIAEARIKSRERLEMKTRGNIELLRQEARALLNIDRVEQDRRLLSAVSGGQARLRLEGLGAGTITQRDTDQQRRAERAERARIATRARLNTLLRDPAASVQAGYIQTLITRERELLRLQGEAIAKQAQLNNQRGKSGGFFAGLKSAPGNLFDSEGEGGGTFGAGALVGRVAAYAVAASAIYGVISAMRQAVSFTIEFENSLAQLQAVSGSTGAEMDRLKSSILEVSKTSANSVDEITKAATVIAQAGFSGNEIGGIVQSATNLAAASGSTVDESVDILTSALGAFRLSAQESDRVVNTLVTTLNDSKLSVAQVRLGLQFLGNTAAQNNISFEELTATLGAMADAGIRSGSTIATGTRQLLVDLLDPSKKLITELTQVGLTTADIDVKTLGLTEVLRRLRDAGFQAYGTLETRAAAAFVAQSANIDNIERLIASTNNLGATQDAVDARTSSLTVKWQQFVSKLSEAAIAIGDDLIPSLKVLLQVLEVATLTALGFVNVITNIWDFFTRRLPTAIDQFTGGMLGLSDTVKVANVDLAELAMKMEQGGASAEQIAEAMAAAEGSNVDLITSIKDTSAEMSTLETTQDSLRKETSKLITRQEDLTKTTNGVDAQIAILQNRFPGLREEMEITGNTIGGLIRGLQNLDAQAASSLASFARSLRAKNELLLSDANTRLEGLQQSGNNIILDGILANPLATQDPIDKEFRERLASGDFEGTLDFASQNKELFETYSETLDDVVDAIQDRDRATVGLDIANQDIANSEFAASGTGRVLQERINRDVGNAQRATSQGSSNGKSLAEIQADLAQTESFVNRLITNNGTNATLESALVSVTQSKNSLIPDPPSSSELAGARRAQRAAEKRQRLLDKNNAKIEAAQAKEMKAAFDNTLQAITNAEGVDSLPMLVESADQALQEWLDSESEAAVASIINDTGGVGTTDRQFLEQRAQMLDTARRKANEMQINNINRIAAALEGAIVEFVNVSVQGINEQFEQATSFARRNLNIAQARVQGLSNPIGSNDRPGFMSTVVQREADVAQDRLNRATLPARATQITQLKEVLEQAESSRTRLQELLRSNLDEVSKETTLNNLGRVKTDIISLSQEIRTLEEENAALAASFAVLNESPTTFAAGLSLALKAVAIDINAASSLGQELINNLDKPLVALRDGFKGFFDDLMSGTVSVAGAFRRMASSVISSILDIVSTALANQLFKFLGSSLGGAFSPGASAGGGGGGFASGFAAAWNGGSLERKISGGSIRSGLPTRDSTLIAASRDEFVMRRAAVQSIGVNALNAMNSQGAAALKGMGSPIMMGGGQPVETNVYLISPEQQPQLGPNDVIAVISNDVLQGGTTKKLIKRVANGG